MIIDSIHDNGLSLVIGKPTTVIGKPTTFTRVSFKLQLLRTVWVLCIGLALMVDAICIPESWAGGVTCTCCCSDDVTIDVTCSSTDCCLECCSSSCPKLGHGDFLYEGQCKEEGSTEVTYGRSNRSYNKSQDTGDPITTNSGAYYFDMSLLNPGGPMQLGFTFIYRSDEDNTMTRTPNDFPARHLATRFWWSPRCRAKVETDYITFWLQDGSMVAFKKQDSLWQLFEGSLVAQPDNGQPIRYAMQETDDYLYLMSPIKEMVYIFQKGGSETAKGRILRIMDRNGNQLIYTYADADHNNPSKIDDGLGRELNFTYSTPTGGEESLTTVTDQAGREITFEYEYAADNNYQWSLGSVTDAMRHTTVFGYQAITHVSPIFLDNISGLTKPLGNDPYAQVYGYHEISAVGAVRVDSQTDVYGNTMNFTWDTDAYKMTEDHPDGSTVISEDYSHHSPPKSWTDGAGNTVDFTKDDHGQITSIKDRLGDTSRFTYHAETGKPASITNARGDISSNSYTAQNQTFTNLDNAETAAFTFYNLTRTDYPDGTNDQFTYDASGNVLTRVDRAGKIWTYTYNSWGQVLTVTNPTGGVTTYAYNSDATLASSTDSDIGLTTYGYDGYKRLNRITHPDAAFVQIAYNLNDQVSAITDENSHTYTYTYDANGNLARVTDPASNNRQYAHDLIDRVNQVTDRLGKVSTLAYDNMGRIGSVTDPNSIQTSFGYNNRGWLTGTTIGGRTWQTGYDDEKVVSSRTTPLGYSTAFQTDRLGHTTGITDPLSLTTTVTRDAMGRITAATDPLNRTTHYSYDAGGLVSGVTLPVAGAASYTRNDMGLLSGITDLNGSHWTFGYTNMGRLQSIADPLGNIWRHTYDTRGRLNRITYPDAQTMTRTYDNAGNLTRSLYSGDLDLQYAYDGLDRLLTANGVAFTRDVEGRVTATDNPGTIFGATYDDGGRLATATYNNGAFTVTYTYELFTGLLSRVTDSLTNSRIDFSYDNDGRPTGITRSNGVNTTLTWDNAARLTRIQDGSIIDIQYALDAAGQVTRADMTVPLDPASLLVSEANTFTYDAASRISSTGYTYDSRGRQTAAAGHTYTWDNASRLTGMDGVTLAYNGLGDLTARTEGALAIHYYHNDAIGLKPIAAEKDEGSGQFLRYYVWTPGGRLLYMIDSANGNKAYFYHFNRTGSTLALTDATGTVTDSYAYTPYGKRLRHNGASEQPFTFVGAWGVRHEGTGGTVYQMRARYYDAATGRFLSRERLWPDVVSPKMLNPYQYAMGQPNLLVDPTGGQPLPPSQMSDTALSEELRDTQLAYFHDNGDKGMCVTQWTGVIMQLPPDMMRFVYEFGAMIGNGQPLLDDKADIYLKQKLKNRIAQIKNEIAIRATLIAIGLNPARSGREAARKFAPTGLNCPPTTADRIHRPGNTRHMGSSRPKRTTLFYMDPAVSSARPKRTTLFYMDPAVSSMPGLTPK